LSRIFFATNKDATDISFTPTTLIPVKYNEKVIRHLKEKLEIIGVSQ